MSYRPKILRKESRIVSRSPETVRCYYKMVEEDKYCMDVIHQSQAVQGALRQTDNVLLENHLQTCVGEFFKSGEQKKATEELMRVFRKN